mgnify:CR=1 FL=1|jgi:hypothetical protein|tara:strand:- start:41 stop:217 length:177 start_codon:yes stop_codon:yes gene_type:complete
MKLNKKYKKNGFVIIENFLPKKLYCEYIFMGDETYTRKRAIYSPGAKFGYNKYPISYY